MKNLILAAFAIFGFTSTIYSQYWTSGTPWPGPSGQYQTGITGGVTKLVEYNNELYASGNFIEAGGLIANCIARWNGANWNTVYQGDLIQNSVVYDMIVFNDKLYFIGNKLYSWDGSNIEILTYIDEFDNISNILGASSNFCIYDGYLYLGAGLTLFKISSDNIITTESINGVNVGEINFVSALEVFNGDFYLGGYPGVYKYVNGVWISISGNTVQQIKDLAVFENKLYALGTFNSIGLVAANNFATFDGVSWTNEQLLPNTSIMVNTPGIVTPNSLNVIGNTLILTFPTSPGMMPNVFAKQNGNWNPLGSFDPLSPISGNCFTSCQFQNEIYVGGSFGNGTNIRNLMKIGSSVLNSSKQLETSFHVFPNPAQSVINVKADGKLVGDVYIISDNTGKVVLTGKLNSQNTIIELDNLSSGIYMFSVGENMKQTFKVIKE